MKNMRNLKAKNTRDYPQIFTIGSDEVVSGGRLDAKYWIPAIRELQKAIQNGKCKSQKLGDFITDIHYGVSTTNEYVDDGIRLLRILNLKDEGLDLNDVVYLPEEKRSIIGRAFVHEGDILISRSGSVGIVVVVPKEADGFAFGSFMIRFALNDKINKQYVAAWLNSKASRKLIEREKIGAIQGNITIETIKNFDIPVLPLLAQKKVAGKIQEAYEQKRNKEKEMEKILSSIDEFVLGELGIVSERERVSGRAEIFIIWSNEIAARIDPLYHRNISRLKKFKSKYKMITLAEITKEGPQYGANVRAIDGIIGQDTRYIRITDVDPFGNLREDDWKTAEKIQNKYLLSENDLLFARSGATAGKTFIYKDEFGKALFAGYMIRFKLDEQKANPDYIFAFTKTLWYDLWVKTIQRPSGQPNINAEEFKSLQIPLPPLDMQNKIAEEVQNRRAKVRDIQIQAAEILASAHRQVEQMILP